MITVENDHSKKPLLRIIQNNINESGYFLLHLNSLLHDVSQIKEAKKKNYFVVILTLISW